MNYLLKLVDPAAARPELCGGKGANLALLTQRGFPVPPGFVITAPAYREFIAAAPSLPGRIARLPFDDPGRLNLECERLRSGLEKLSLPDGLAEEVRTALAEFAADQTFAVRSSSTMEDLANAAFAGQHETYLNCLGADQILEKIKACYLSLWSDRAVAYRRQQGFDHALAAMAVVVQPMIRCDVAGVGFSINPVTGDLGQMIVDANFGLGESVVGGEAEVDHFEIDKATRALLRATIAAKTRKIVCDVSGTREVELPAGQGSQACLNPAQIERLAELLFRVEESFRFPQDIEWGWAAGRYYLFQSRPVTAVPPRWTRDESAERFPNVLTPLTWDFVESGFHRSLNHSFRLMGFPAFDGKWFGMFGHYIYGNQNAVELYLRRAPFAVSSLDELKALIPRLREQYRWVQELPVRWMRDLDFHLIKLGEFMAEPLDQKDLAGVWRFVLKVNEHGAQYFLPNIAISITHATLFRLLHGLLKMTLGPQDTEGLFDGLMAWCETKTGVINRELFEMAQQIRTIPELERLLAATDSRKLAEPGRLERFEEFHARFQKFLRDHGHREVDFDAYHATWIEAPWIVFDNLRLILQTPMDRTPAGNERELKLRMQQAEFELFTRLPQDLHFFFHEVLRLARAYTSLDDLEHYQTTRLTLPLRKGLRELGRRMVARGVLNEPMDVFFARWRQIEDAVQADCDAGWKTLGNAVRAQKAAYLTDRARTPEWNLNESRTEEPLFGDCLRGLAGSAGRAEGEVYCVQTAEDFARFPKGAVLVARTTNPTWTPLFYSACAVVTESGGPLSHGAVTAREMKIPAVMSVKNCLARLKNGQRVKVDGTHGRVVML